MNDELTRAYARCAAAVDRALAKAKADGWNKRARKRIRRAAFAYFDAAYVRPLRERAAQQRAATAWAAERSGTVLMATTGAPIMIAVARKEKGTT